MDETTPEVALWQRTLEILERDSRITGSMMGFAALAEVKGIIGETIYLEVPNDLTRSMFEQRLKEMINEAFASIEDKPPVDSVAVVVNTSINANYTPTTSATAAASTKSMLDEQNSLSSSSSQFFMKMPTTSWPCFFNKWAVTAESTPPDKPTTIL